MSQLVTRGQSEEIIDKNRPHISAGSLDLNWNPREKHLFIIYFIRSFMTCPVSREG